MQVTRVGPEDYYDFLPPSDHYPGDIWSGLPTFGVLPQHFVSGVVITPACDLTNHKVDSITFLPMSTVSAYLSSRCVLPEIRRTIRGLLRGIGHEDLDDCDAIACRLGDHYVSLAAVMSDIIATNSHRDKDRQTLDRARTGAILGGIICGAPSDGETAHLRTLLGQRDFEALVRNIVRNSHRSDIHFLPSDGQQADWSGVPVHSVALFRYPTTIPLDILTCASEVSGEEWPAQVAQLARLYPCASVLLHGRPMKRLRVKPRFMSDLITRYLATYGRLGSPDFSGDTIARYTSEILET